MEEKKWPTLLRPYSKKQKNDDVNLAEPRFGHMRSREGEGTVEERGARLSYAPHLSWGRKK